MRGAVPTSREVLRDLHVRVAAAAAAQAQAEGVARLDVPRAALEAQAAAAMRTARETTHVLMREGLIPPPPA